MNSRPRSDNTPQLDLLGGVAQQSAPVHRLFFALLPDASTRQQLQQAAQALRSDHAELRARWINPARYHATVHFLGDHAGLRQDVVDAASKAASKLRIPSFEWVLDSAVSFHGRQPPCVFRAAVVPAPLQRLWDELRHLLILLGQGRHIERSFSPHVTVAYSQGAMLEHSVIEPVPWRVDAIALVHSVVGQADYEILARWTLPTTCE